MRRRTLISAGAVTMSAALVIGVGVLWPGLDAQQTTPVDASVWTLQTGEGRGYARVNTAIGELDTVRSISDPDRIVQTADAAYVFSGGYRTLTRIDEAAPVDLDAAALRESASTPAGTTEVATAGEFVAYLTDGGAVYAGLLSADTPARVDPWGEDDPFTADAVALAADGTLTAFSADAQRVVQVDVTTGEARETATLVADDLSEPVVTAAGDTWAVVDAEDGDVWLRGADGPVRGATVGTAVVARAHADADAVYLADEAGLVRVGLEGAEPQRAFGTGTTVLGVPAVPVWRSGELFAAWVGEGDTGGTLWNSRTGPVALDYGAGTLGTQRRPVFSLGTGGGVLNETRSGWSWSVPTGTLIASSQDWSLDEQIDQDADQSDEQLPVQLTPKPPIAELDAFGVRAGSLSALPVLLNDHDANEDVLAIDAASVTGLDPAFGEVSITDDGQRLAVRTTPEATGTATFTYAVTDGTAEGGLMSASTTVTLTVAGDVDSAPQWCGVERCLVPWPQPEVARGGTVTVPVLSGWVDPEGDPLFLLGVENTSGVGSVAATPEGDVVYQHSDDGSGGETLVELAVTVGDTRGEASTRSLIVRVSPEPALRAQSFAVVDVFGGPVTIDVAEHVTGTAGLVRVASVRVVDDAPATATVVEGTTSFEFSARAPGTYRVGVDVTDGVSTASTTARVTVLPADAPPQLSTAPVVAFVHPREDATVDVLAAVSNPTRRVLLLSDVAATADPGATLSVDAVGQSFLRVSGSTATGAPGRLGTVRYTVSDGTEDAGAAVVGEATVYLLPPAAELAPIAVDDTVVVRAGAQVDVPVLANDIAPSGGRPVLDPSSVAASDPTALAFASGDLLRLLAPNTPGTFTVDYGVYTAGSPTLVDTATVTIRVTDDEVNRPPTPETLEGRVLSGQSVTIEVPGFGMDPDGDVVSLDGIVDQPERGAASVAGDGRSIVYTSVGGDSGQVSFSYRVVDAEGEAGIGRVRVGVLDAQVDPSPVTYTDYVQVQAGTGTVRVSPLANDVDPTGGDLTLTAVRPDVAAVTVAGEPVAEYARLAGRLRPHDDTTVQIASGDEPGTMAFLYDVESSSGNTARGRIVVQIVRDVVADYPVVADTVLTAETRDRFESGVDVIDGAASWTAGDVEGLEVSLWGEQAGVEVVGTTLRGALPASTRVIPFAVTGEGPSGEVTTYAFLRVPGDDDLALTLRAGLPPIDVDELGDVRFDMADLVVAPRGSRLAVGADASASGARTDARCVLERGTTLRYTAGTGAPWTDACLVPVRLDEGDEWTVLSVPIVVRPQDPQPVLKAASLTVGPGETATYDLRDLTSWELRADWAGIVYAVGDAGPDFAVTLDGSVLTVTAADAAPPGRESVAPVSVTSHADVAPGRVILRVGAAPSTLPSGGTVSQQCSQASGDSCTITVIGAGGEVNPLPRTPLSVVGVAAASACVGVTFEVASRSAVTARWADDAPGGTCTARVTLSDAQGRVTAAERDARVTLDLLGYPQAPASLAQVAYADGSVTLAVDPGAARQAYPALTGFVVLHAGVVVAECDDDGRCPAIAAPNGEERAYEAFSVNALGRSAASVRTSAWAYDPPPAPTRVTARPVITSGEGGVIALSVEGIVPRETAYLEVTSATGETLRVPVRRGQESIEIPSYRVGTNTATPVRVTPYSRFAPPPGLEGSLSGSAVSVAANGVGAPREVTLTLGVASNGDGTSTVTARGTAQSGGDGSELRLGIVRDGERCTPTPDGGTATFPGLADGTEYRFVLCAESTVDGEVFGRTEVSESVRAQQSGRAPRDWTFLVDRAPNVSDGRAEWVIRDEPTSDDRIPNNNRVEFTGGPPTGVFGRDPGILVRYVHRLWGTATPWAAVTPRTGSAPFQVQANWAVASCTGGGALVLTADASRAPDGRTAAVTFDPSALRYLDEDGDVVAHEAGTWDVPRGAVRVEGVGVRVDWATLAWGLDPATSTFSGTCDPRPLPPTEPDPTPTPTPTP
jgi:hypothetical protein